MPGQPLDLDIPVASEAFYPAFVKIIAALQTIETDLEADVVPSEIDFSQGDVDLAGNDLLGAQSVQLEPAAATTGYPSGSAILVGGEWYLVTDDGAVQVTSGGGLNAAGIGGIVGDYGGLNPAKVTYVDSSEVYQFTDAPGDWSNIECDSLIVHGASAAYTISLSDAAVSNKTLLITSTFVPTAAGRALLTCDESGNLRSTEGGSVTISPTIAADVILSGSAEIQHGSWSRVFHPKPYATSNTDGAEIVWLPTTGGVVVTTQGGASSAGTSYEYQLDGWLVGDVVTSLTFAHKGAAAGDDITIAVVQVDQTGTEISATPSPSSKNDIGTSWGTCTVTLTSPINIGAGETVVLRITKVQSGAMSLGTCTVNFTHV